MPQVFDLEATPESVRGQSCQGLREDLSQCLLNSDCVKKNGRLPSDCLLNPDASVPEQCINMKYLMIECKKSMLDNRQRFRVKRGY